MAHPDHIKSWTAAVDNGFIQGDPAYYYNATGYDADVHHALIVAVLEAHGIDWNPDVVPPVDPPVDPPTGDWGDGVTFMDRTPQDNQIWLTNETGIVIDGLMFDGTTDSEYTYMPGRASNAHVCIYLDNCTDITIRNIDFLHVSQPIAVYGGSNILVEYCRADGVTGPGLRVGEQTGNFIQTYGSPTGVRVLNNKVITGQGYGDPADILSLFSASDSELGFNQVDGTGYLDGRYGTGAILGDGGGNNNRVHNNTFLNSGQVAIGIAGGFGNIVEDNIIYSDHDFDNTAAYYWDFYAAGIGDGGFRNNRSKFVRGGGLWNPDGGFDEGNVWDDDTIDPADLVVVL